MSAPDSVDQARHTVLRLTPERRRGVCIHEAAHAVTAALGGEFVHRLQVAPVGASEWTVDSRKGKLLTGLWGLCSVSGSPPVRWLGLNGSEILYKPDRKGFEATLRNAGGSVLSAARHELRAQVCHAIAGPVVDAIVADASEPVWIDWGLADEHHDVRKAWALAGLLPGAHEADRLASLTEQALRHPPIWDAVIRLANALELAGDMDCDAIEPYLPEALPNWPPSQYMKPVHLPETLRMREPAHSDGAPLTTAGADA